MSSFGYVDIGGPRNRLMILPRKRGETRAAYALRFQRETYGLGRIFVVTVKGKRTHVRATRSW